MSVRSPAVGRIGTALGLLALLAAAPVRAAVTDCATSWSNFTSNPGFITEYTDKGQIIADNETSSDPSHGPAAVPPTWTDLASGSPADYPGPYATSFFGYYNGGTPYDPGDPVTMQDDYILFRMRVAGDPSKGAGFDSKHWNVLFDVDGDGYKEFWVDLDGSVASGASAPDALKILYDNANRQDVPDPVGAEVSRFEARHSNVGAPSCGGSSPGRSHTRSFAVGDGTGDYYIEMQVPMTAFVDLQGNQVLFPDSPVAFVFSTGASNQDPLQKDFMKDLGFLTLADPIDFGDVIIPNGKPVIQFVDASLESADFYFQDAPIFLTVVDRFANTDPNAVDCIQVTVTDPATGDDESVTLCETTPNSGFFTNNGGACAATITSPSPAPSPATAWVRDTRTSSTTVTETWTLVYSSSAGTWSVTGSVSGLQTARVTAGTLYTSDTGRISFNLYQDSPANGTTLQTCTLAADPLTNSASAGLDDDGDLQTNGGDQITVSYTNVNSVTVTDEALIVAPCLAIIQFTRANGDPTNAFELNASSSLSDRVYVTVVLREANANPAVAETISVTLTGNDTQTITLTETGPNTGVFRNTGGLATQVSDGTVVANDGLWEDLDGGSLTATYDYSCGGNNYSRSTTASIFYTSAGGRVYFSNGAGTQDVELYGADEPVYLRVVDANACTVPVVIAGATIRTVTVSVTTVAPVDTESVTLYETFSGSGVFMNRLNDLVTTASSATVTAASGRFLSDGLTAGSRFAIANGPDAGLYTVQSVASETQLTLTQALSASRTAIGYDATPLLTATTDGSVAADSILEATHDSGIAVAYSDCDDGDPDPSNDVKTDTATYNAPSLILNWVMFYPDPSTGCLTESVEILNGSSAAVNATGYSVSDADGYSYTVPQFQGADLVLQPGERIFISLWNSTPPADFFDNSSGTGTYLLFDAGTAGPPDEFADPGNADPADQVLLFDASGVVQDYIGWSSTLSPSLDFYSDDSPAVLRGIWVDNSFRNVTTIATDDAIQRSPTGFDTNTASDWAIATGNSACAVIATRAVVASIRAVRSGGSVVVEWETASEDGTLGFDLMRREGGRLERVTARPVPASRAPQGGLYRVEDPGAGAASELSYVLVEHEQGPHGVRERHHGPWHLKVESGELAGPVEAGPARAREATPQERARRDAHRSSRARAGAGAARVGARVKLTLRDSGSYRVEASELAAAFGLPEGAVRGWLRAGQLELSRGGEPVAWAPSADGGGLLFYGRAVDSIFTDENAYWIEHGAGVRMGIAPAERGPGSAPLDWFSSQLHLEQDRTPFTTGGGDPEGDFWYWHFLFGGWPGLDTQKLPFDLVDLAPEGGSGRLAVRLRGGSATGLPQEHHVELRLNGFALAEARLTGFEEKLVEVAVPASQLRASGNQLELVARLDPGVAWSLVYLDSLDLSWPRRFRARDGRLQFRLERAGAVVVDGFATADVTVFDVSDPDRAQRVGSRVERAGGGFRVELTGRAGATYQVTSSDALRRPSSLRAAATGGLRDPGAGADYVVIAPQELLEAARELAAWRESRGLQALVVSFEELVDEFHHGVRSPHAIGAFLGFALENWSRPPRYVVLAGAGHFDYKDNLGLGGNLLPPLLAGTSSGFFASDSRLADVSGDGVPDVAMGRLPVLTAEELHRYVEKLRSHEAGSGAPWRDRTLLLADDNPGEIGHFARDAESMAAYLPPELPPEHLYLGLDGKAAAIRSRLLKALADGVGLLGYVGHGGFDRLADEGLLMTRDIASIENADRRPVVAAFSCVINRFDLPYFDSIGEVMLLAPGGAVAVWAPTGLSIDVEAASLGRELFKAAFLDGTPRLGDAILEAFDRYAKPGSDPELPLIYNLLGDPALELRLDR